jgi:triacylglycerol lipase
MREKAGQIALDGIEQLRWLFAGNMELLVLNLEPATAAGLLAIQEPKPDHAKVYRLVNPGADAKVIFADNPIPAVLISAPPRPIRAGLVPRQPVVFCHGMLAFSTLSMQMPEDSNCFSPLRDFLHSRGFRALFPHVAPTSSVALRAEQLRMQISRWTNEPVNLIAHSMGGLDARFMISQLGMAKQVCSLTTVSTPHRGTYLVDWFLTNFRQRLPLMIALESAGFDVAGFRDCRPAACRDFNMRITDVPGVSYFSFGGEVPVGRVTPPLRRAWSLLTAEEGPNDGMVSVASARWGEYLGTVHADHFAQTPDLKFIHPSEDFDPLDFYFRILENLARRGF